MFARLFKSSRSQNTTPPDNTQQSVVNNNNNNKVIIHSQPAIKPQDIPTCQQQPEEHQVVSLQEDIEDLILQGKSPQQNEKGDNEEEEDDRPLSPLFLQVPIDPINGLPILDIPYSVAHEVPISSKDLSTDVDTDPETDDNDKTKFSPEKIIIQNLDDDQDNDYDNINQPQHHHHHGNYDNINTSVNYYNNFNNAPYKNPHHKIHNNNNNPNNDNHFAEHRFGRRAPHGDMYYADHPHFNHHRPFYHHHTFSNGNSGGDYSYQSQYHATPPLGRNNNEGFPYEQQLANNTAFNRSCGTTHPHHQTQYNILSGPSSSSSPISKKSSFGNRNTCSETAYYCNDWGELQTFQRPPQRVGQPGVVGNDGYTASPSSLLSSIPLSTMDYHSIARKYSIDSDNNPHDDNNTQQDEDDDQSNNNNTNKQKQNKTSRCVEFCLDYNIIIEIPSRADCVVANDDGDDDASSSNTNNIPTKMRWSLFNHRCRSDDDD